MHVRVASSSQPSKPAGAAPRAKTSSRILVEGDKDPRSGWHYGHATDDTTLSRRDEIASSRNVPLPPPMDQSPWAPPSAPAQPVEAPAAPRMRAEGQIASSTLTLNRKALERVRKQREERLARTAPSATLASPKNQQRIAPVPQPPREAAPSQASATQGGAATQPGHSSAASEGRAANSSEIKWAVIGAHPTGAGAVPPVHKTYIPAPETSSPRIVNRFAFDGVVEETVRLVSSYVPSRSVLRQPRQRAAGCTTIQHVPGNRVRREAARRAVNGEGRHPAAEPVETPGTPTMQMRTVSPADVTAAQTLTPASPEPPQNVEEQIVESASPARTLTTQAPAAAEVVTPPPAPPAAGPVPPPPVPEPVPSVVEDPAITAPPTARASRARHSRLDPDSQRPRILLSTLTVTVLAALAVVGWQSYTQYGPALTAQHVANQYVAALAEGNVHSAYALEPYEGLAILNDAAYSDVRGRPSQYTLGMLKKDGDSANISVTWRTMDSTKRSSLSLVREYAGPFGLIPQWRITKGLAVPVTLTVESTSIHDSVAQIDINDSGTYVRATNAEEGTVVALFPGVYSFEVSHSARYADFGAPQDLVVEEDPGQPTVVSFSEHPNELLLQDASDIAEEQLRACLSELNANGCPNQIEDLGLGADQVSQFQWTLESPNFVLSQDGARLEFTGVYVFDYTHVWRGGVFGGAQAWAGSDNEPVWDEQRTIDVTGSWRVNTLGEQVTLVFE